MVGEDQIQGGAGLRLVVVVPVGVIPAAALGDLIRRQTEQEEVLLAGFLRHLDRCPVARTDGQGAVHHEFHVAGAAGFVTRGRDLVRDIAGGNQTLRERNVVFRQEQHLQSSSHGGIAVDGAGKVLDKLDDELGQPVRRRCLAREEKRPRRHFQVRILPQAVVEHHDAQRIQQLPFVFVNSLDLAIEDGFRVHRLAEVRT